MELDLLEVGREFHARGHLAVGLFVAEQRVPASLPTPMSAPRLDLLVGFQERQSVRVHLLLLYVARFEGLAQLLLHVGSQFPLLGTRLA